MTTPLPVALLEELIRHLKKPTAPRPSASRLGPRARELVRTGLISWSEVGDLVRESPAPYSCRLDAVLMGLAAHVGIPMRHLFDKPQHAKSTLLGVPGLQAADAAALLIILEALGMCVNPALLVARLVKPLRHKLRLTDSEVRLYTYDRRRHRSRSVLESDLDRQGTPGVEEQFTSSHGYRFKVLRVDGQATRLEVRGPQYRKPRPCVTQICEYCGTPYTQGDPHSSLAHRRAHARLKRLLEPVPNHLFAQRLERHPMPELVDGRAPFWMHHEVYERALRFKRDFEYDCVQWDGSRSRKASPAFHGYLFADHTDQHPPGTIIGACAFTRRHHQWTLAWIWVAPSMRRHGALTRRWQVFLRDYGDFQLEHPLSDAMLGFVRRYGTKQQRADLEDEFSPPDRKETTASGCLTSCDNARLGTVNAT